MDQNKRSRLTLDAVLGRYDYESNLNKLKGLRKIRGIVKSIDYLMRIYKHTKAYKVNRSKEIRELNGKIISS